MGGTGMKKKQEDHNDSAVPGQSLLPRSHTGAEFSFVSTDRGLPYGE
jgi:hypothetical protein